MRWIVCVLASLLLGVYGWKRPAKPAWELNCTSSNGTCSVVGFNAQDQLIALQHQDDSADELCVYDTSGDCKHEFPLKGIHSGNGFVLPDKDTVMVINYQIDGMKLDFVSWRNRTKSGPSIPVNSAGNPQGSDDGRYLLVNPRWEKSGQMWMADLHSGLILYPVQHPMAFGVASHQFVELEKSVDGDWAVFRRLDDGVVVNRISLPNPEPGLEYATIAWSAHDRLELHLEEQHAEVARDRNLRAVATYALGEDSLKELIAVHNYEDRIIEGRGSQQFISENPKGVFSQTVSDSILGLGTVRDFLQRKLNIGIRVSGDGRARSWERLTGRGEQSTHPIVFPIGEHFAVSEGTEYFAVGGHSLRFWKIEPNHQWRDAIACGAIPFGISLVLIAWRRRSGRMDPNCGSPAGGGTCPSR